MTHSRRRHRALQAGALRGAENRARLLRHRPLQQHHIAVGLAAAAPSRAAPEAGRRRRAIRRRASCRAPRWHRSPCGRGSRPARSGPSRAFRTGSTQISRRAGVMVWRFRAADIDRHDARSLGELDPHRQPSLPAVACADRGLDLGPVRADAGFLAVDDHLRRVDLPVAAGIAHRPSGARVKADWASVSFQPR